MIKVKSESYGQSKEQLFDADEFETSSGFVILRKAGSMVAMFAAGYWSSVEREAAPKEESQPVA